MRLHSKKLSLTAAIVLLAALGVLVYGLQQPAGAPTETSTIKPPATTPSPLACAEKMPTAELVGQVLMIGLPASGMAQQASIFRQYNIGGAVLMTSPTNPYDGSIKQFKAQAASAGIEPLISTDEEGGIVQRFVTVGALPSPQDAASEFTPAQAEQLVASHGTKLKSIGIDMVLGPLADVAPADGQSPLGNRVFSANPDITSQYAEAYVQGWQQAGLLPTIKHFPGLGAATGNTDYAVATTPPLSSLMQRDFIPYKVLATSGTAVMVGNQNVPGWFDGPASLNPLVDHYLRQTLGYKNNLVVTDSLAATAVSSSIAVPQAVVKAIAAGNDIALVVDPNVSNITAAKNTAWIVNAETALKQAVDSGVISRQQLAQSVVRKLTAQHVPACAVTPR